MKTGKQEGFVLVTVLVLMLLLTIVVVMNMKTNVTNYQLTSNHAANQQTFNYAESGLIVVSSIIDDHLAKRDWTGVTMPKGLSVVTPVSGGTDVPTLLDDTTESGSMYGSTHGLTRDFEYTMGDVTANIYVIKGQRYKNAGVSSAMLSGYLGLGKSEAKGGVNTIFEVRSEGEGVKGAKSVTASDYNALLLF
jgi:Tfp pilus assembly protein PilX